jgi:hypothetical protein
MQVTIISSKLAVKDIFHRKCVYMLNDFFDDRKNQKCVQVTESSWFVWKCGVEEPYFGKDADFMAKKFPFPVFAYVYEVKVKLQANQHFLKCDCLHYERCGIPCTHIMKITDEIDETMITVQHQKMYSIHFGLPDSQLSDQLMKPVSMQILHEDLGMPITIACLEKANHPKIIM